MTLGKDLQAMISYNIKVVFSFQTPRTNDKGDIRSFYCDDPTLP